MMERQRPQSKVSLEDLLRLKRAERPAPEFWAEFEDELRRKQLAAIVDKRPWWRRLSTAGLAKISIPVGATAVIVFTLVAARESGQSAPGTSTVVATSASSESSVPAPVEQTLESSSADTVGAMVASSEQATAPSSSKVSASATSVDEPAYSRASTEITGSLVATPESPGFSLAQVILGFEGTTESDARSHFQPDGARLHASMDILDGTSARSLPLLDSSPLRQVSAARDDRRARLLASVDTQDRADMVSGNSRVARSRERIASRLSEQSLYDSISRLGLNGDSVSIKF